MTQAEFEDAKDKVMMGAERRSMVMSEEEKRNTAYHEAGHAIVGLSVPYDPLHKVTIIPRGRALGVTMNLPEGDRYSRTREWCEARLAVLFGGREAEIILGGADNVTNGATGDIQMATQLARAMVTEWGMSDKLGRVRYNGNEQESLPRPFGDADQEPLGRDGKAHRRGDPRPDPERRGDGQAASSPRRSTRCMRSPRRCSSSRRSSGEEVQAIMRGDKVIRRSDDDGTKGPVGSAVPAAGRSRPREEPGTGRHGAAAAVLIAGLADRSYD